MLRFKQIESAWMQNMIPGSCDNINIASSTKSFGDAGNLIDVLFFLHAVACRI
jgi:hypothetical protein